MIEIILLGHRKRVGKDMLAQMLCERDGFYRVAYADKLKEIVTDLFRFTRDQIEGESKEVVDERYGMSPRHILQQVGTEQMRSLYPNIWTDYVLKSKIPLMISEGYRKFVVTDLRFPNEHTEALKHFGNNCIVRAVKIERPCLPPLDGSEHPSETALSDYLGWDRILINSGSPEDLYNQFKRRMCLTESDNYAI